MPSPKKASLGTIHKAFYQWILSLSRVDCTTTNMPVSNPPGLFDIIYPSNTLLFQPVSNVNYEKNSFGLICEAEFRFVLSYRFLENFRYEQLPIVDVEEILNNLYIAAIDRPAQIHPAIRTVRTPNGGTDVRVLQAQDNQDYVIQASLYLFASFQADYGDTSYLQPTPTDPVVNPISLEIGVYRAEAGNLSNNRLDRTIQIEN